MKFIRWQSSIHSSLVFAALSLALVFPSSIVLADDQTPPQSPTQLVDSSASAPDAGPPAIEAASQSGPASVASPVSDPAPGSGDALGELPPAAASNDSGAPAADGAADPAPVSPESDPASIGDAVTALADAGAVIVDSSGANVPLASEQAAAMLAAPDPYIVRGGVTYNFTAADCDPMTAGLQPCNNPIQSAVNFALAGELINVAAGTFTEQVTIGKSVTLTGAGAGSSTIQAPGVLVADPIDGYRSIILIDGIGISVDLSGFTISGPGPGGCNSINYGIYVRGGAYAHIHDNAITDVRDNPFSGCQNGVAIQVGRQSKGQTGTATIENNDISGYQKNGITVDNAGSSAVISDNTVTGAGPTSAIAQNGIQVSRGATATLDGNTVTGNDYSPGTTTSTGVLLYQPGSGVIVENNTLTGNQTNLYVVQGNNVQILDNTIADSNQFDDVSLDASNGATLQGNIFSNAGTSGAGVAIFNGSSNITLTLNQFLNNPIAGLYSDTSDPGSIEVHDNVITGNGTGVINNQPTLGDVDATGNWWGCPAGPNDQTCDSVSSGVLYDPWLTADPTVILDEGSGGGKHSTGDAVPATIPAIPVTGGALNSISCSYNPFVLELPSQNLGLFFNLCSYGVILDEFAASALPAALPDGLTYADGMTFSLFKKTEVLNEVPTGSQVKLSFQRSTNLNAALRGLFWDAAANQGLGAWKEVPVESADGYATLVADFPGTYVVAVTK